MISREEAAEIDKRREERERKQSDPVAYFQSAMEEAGLPEKLWQEAAETEAFIDGFFNETGQCSLEGTFFDGNLSDIEVERKLSPEVQDYLLSRYRDQGGWRWLRFHEFRNEATGVEFWNSDPMYTDVGSDEFSSDFVREKGRKIEVLPETQPVSPEGFRLVVLIRNGTEDYPQILEEGESDDEDWSCYKRYLWYLEKESIQLELFFIEEKLLPRSIDELELSVRPYNALKNAAIRTIEKLGQYTERDLKEKGFTAKSIREIKESLEHLGLSLKPE